MATVWRRAGIGLLLVSLFIGIAIGRANAAPTLLNAGSEPVISARLSSGSLTVRTWDRPQVEIDSDGQVDWKQVPPQIIAMRQRTQIPMYSQTIQTLDGPVTLPFEAFVIPPLSSADHDGVTINGYGNTTVMIPNSSAMVIAQVAIGDVSIEGYHDGVFFTQVHNGNVHLTDVSGTGGVQVASGQIYASNSDFSRLRARTARGNLIFENCHSKQIEATSVLGSIAYDNGSFEPGLAHFQSERGNVAIGVAGTGGVQVGAHSTSGQVYSELPRNANVQRQPNDTQATINGGGPVITASSRRGSVFLYNGALSNHPQMQQRIPNIHRQLQQRGRSADSASAQRAPAASGGGGRRRYPPSSTTP